MQPHVRAYYTKFYRWLYTLTAVHTDEDLNEKYYISIHHSLTHADADFFFPVLM